MFVHSEEMQFDPDGRLHTFCHAVRGKWHMMGVNLSAGGCLQWFRDNLCASEVEAAKNISDIHWPAFHDATDPAETSVRTRNP